MVKKISDFFDKKTFKIELNKDEEEAKIIKSEEFSVNLNLNKNVKTEAEQQLLVILPQQNIKKFSIPVKTEENEPKTDNFQCQICKKVLSTTKTFKSHELIHNKKFQCKICDKMFPTNAQLKEHTKNIHENPGSFKCNYCKLRFNLKASLDYHVKYHCLNLPKPFKCSKCDYATDRRRTLNIHLMTHDKIIVRCDKCGCIIRKNVPHDCSLNCKFCGRKFSHINAVRMHVKMKHSHETGKEFFKCDICGLTFQHKRMLVKHLEVKHFGTVQTFVCDFDGRNFNSKDKIILHMKSHLPPVKCDFCKIKIKLRHLKRHIKNFHTGIKYPQKKSIPKTGIFECSICFKILSTKANLKKHFNGHNKTIKCKFCDKMFGCQWSLDAHFRVQHKNPDGYDCEICGKKIIRQSSLKSHMMTHDKNRPRNFKCTICDFATYDQRSHEKHLNFHKRNDAKFAAIKNPRKCQQCPSVFKTKKSLNDHIKRSHPKVLVECDVCGKKMKRKRFILDHFRRIHKIGTN